MKLISMDKKPRPAGISSPLTIYCFISKSFYNCYLNTKATKVKGSSAHRYDCECTWTCLLWHLFLQHDSVDPGIFFPGWVLLGCISLDLAVIFKNKFPHDERESD
ncbi:hypothetical protein JD844_008966 [Phrynosoma platyrhinos]|uniref:Uncharacterized protein n=1 Tax=Phrynosoma platyrhinos TaxID=52577 RepID=A0ABQ7TFC4_PHRPL|nr:hypothetical protein JD844_008966 [Phrynosoma platyrhinos]